MSEKTTNKGSAPTDIQQLLANRLYVSPNSNKSQNNSLSFTPQAEPIYPKRVSAIKNMNGGQKVGNTHYSQLVALPKVLANDKIVAKDSEQKDQRYIITCLKEPLDAVQLLNGAPEGTFFYMQKVDRLQAIITKQLQQVEFKPEYVLQHIQKLIKMPVRIDSENDDPKKTYYFSEKDIKLLCLKEEFEMLIVPHLIVELKDYYTLSQSGITHISLQQHSFTNMQEWLNELVKLQKLRQIPIFKNFRLWKPLKLLKKAVTRNRQTLASQLLGKNLFSINKYLRFALAVTLDCTNGIRSMNVIVTQDDIDAMLRQKQLLRKIGGNKQILGRRQDDNDPDMREIREFVEKTEKFIIKLFNHFNGRKVIQTDQHEQNEDETAFDENQTEANQNINQNQQVLFQFPFTIQNYDKMTDERCGDLRQLFDEMASNLLICVKRMTSKVVAASFGSGSGERTVRTTITSYTEKAARLNMCKRLHSYLRLVDFMLMDSLYDFQYSTLYQIHQRLYEACQFALPLKETVVASQETLLDRERTGQYLFDGKEAEIKDDEKEDENDAILDDEENKLITIGDGSKSLFLGFIQCKISTSEKSQGARELRVKKPLQKDIYAEADDEADDIETPGEKVQPGQTAQIQLYPAAADFDQSFTNFNEQILSHLDTVKRLTNHRDFAEIILPIYTNTDATFEHVDDQNKLLILDEINAPTLQVLFASNPNFKVIVNKIKNELYQQYENALKWSTILQPFYDAFNQCMNLDVDKLQQKFFNIPLSSFKGGEMQQVDAKWKGNFEKILVKTIWNEQNNYEQILNDYIVQDFKEVVNMSETQLNLVIKQKSDVPLNRQSGLNKQTMPEQLFSDEQFNDLLNQLEHNRRLHHSMPQIINLGMFTFDAQDLKKAFLPVAQCCLNFLRTLVPIAIMKRLFILLLNIYQIKKYLNAPVHSIEEYILYREVVQLVSDEVVDTIKAFQTNIIQFIQMYEKHGIKCPNQVNQFLVYFNQQFDLFKNQVINAESTLDEKTQDRLRGLEDDCYGCQKDLEQLKIQMRLKSLNRPVDIFNMQEMAAFYVEYEQDSKDARKRQEKIKSKLEAEYKNRDKCTQSNIAVPQELLEKIEKHEKKLVPECMCVLSKDLDSQAILEQHKFYRDVLEQEGEEVEEPDELEEEKAEVTEVEDEIVPQSENATEAITETTKTDAVAMDESNKLNPEEEKLNVMTYHARLVKSLIFMKFRTKKTQAQKEILDKIEAKIKQVRGYQTNLSVEPHEFPLLDIVSQHVRQYNNLWMAAQKWLDAMVINVRQHFLGQLDQEQLSMMVNNIQKTAYLCEKTITTSQMPAILRARVTEVRNLVPIIQSLDNAALRESHWKNVGDILQKHAPTIEIIINEPVQQSETEENEDEEDEEKQQQFTKKVIQKPQINISWLVNNNAMLYKDQLSQVSSNAANEASLEKQFRKIEAEWAKINLQTTNYKDSNDIYVLKDTVDLITKLEDSILVVSGIACSRYIGEMKETVEAMFDRLKQLNYALDVFLKVQKGYLYLLNIFSSSDIQKQLPNETKLFNSMDEFWKNLLNYIIYHPSAIQSVYIEIFQTKDDTQLIGLSLKPSPLEKQLKKYEMTLDLIQKSLDNYLQNKRMLFPRLFFISDDELLELLALAKNPHALVQHMRKLFENVCSMELVNNVQAGGLEITTLISEENEKLQLIQSVKPRGPLTSWLTQLETKMKQSVARECKKGLDGYQQYQTRNQWILANIAQVIIAASQAFWCGGLTEAIDGKCDLMEAGYGRLKGEESFLKSNSIQQQEGKKKFTPLHAFYNKFESDLQSLITLIKSNLSKLQRGAITALATIETHSRDTIQQLIDLKTPITSTADFQFQKLQRYYYNPNDPECPIIIKQNTTIMPYQNEYLGASARLVITPLTDLVYLHIAVSQQNCKAINLAGPAGTGKSETTKDQNKSRANSCVVFNCSENVEISVMNRFFMGFCMTGAGSCLDEFNRLELSLLSVIAGSIKQILDGLRKIRAANEGKQMFVFNGFDIQLHPDTLLAISLNPGYAGRAELPQNLKNLFRSFSMVVPDYSLISEIILFSQGFTTAKPLSRKVVQLYKLSSEQLSQQNSYDFGMRGVKSVLSMAGNLRRKFPDQSEEMLLIRAMQDSNLPRMIAEDRDLFMGIIQDLFPNVLYKQTANMDFKYCIEKSMVNHKFQLNQTFIEKINQVFDTCQIRHGVLLMGPAKSGKSLCLRTLTEALGFLRKKVETDYTYEQKKTFDSNFPWTAVNDTDIHLINSKSITLNELYGSYDETSGEWKDGLMGNIMRLALERTAVNELKTRKQFILFDSHVSTEWIESMNSLLDDSKLLCLANSERLKINEYINIMFECESLKHASPATVSRLGIIYYPECTLADTIKVCQVQMRPAGYKNLSEDDKQVIELKILKQAIHNSLQQQIVRWDHIIITWFDQGIDQLQTFKALKQNIQEQTASISSKDKTVKSVEQSIYTRLQGLILKLFQVFIPQGLKFYINQGHLILPTNEIQLVRQTLDIFAALLTYNRSLAVKEQKIKQEELDKFAQENGLADSQKANDISTTDPIDLGLIARFLTIQYLQKNQAIFQAPPSASRLQELFQEHVFSSDEYQAFEKTIKQIFMFAFVWSFGGICAAGNKQSRDEFNDLVRTIIEAQNEEYTANKNIDEKDLPQPEVLSPFEDFTSIIPSFIDLPLMPNQGSVFDFYVDWQCIIDLQNQITEAFTCLPISQVISQTHEKYKKIKNDAGFEIKTTYNIVNNLTNINNVLNQVTEEQSNLLSFSIAKPQNIIFETFTDLLKPFIYNPRTPFFNLFIETNDTLRYQHLIESMFKSNLNVLLTGQSGSGKTSVIANMLSALDKRQITQNIQINFSARTSSLRIQQIIEESLIQKGKSYLPQIGKSGIIYIDDVNLPAKDQYECSQPIEFLRFFMDTKGFYDRKELYWKSVENTALLGSCAPPGGGRETMTTRLTSSLTMFAQPESEDDSLVKIYNTILQSYYEYPSYRYPQEIIQSSCGIVKALIQVYHQLAENLKPTPSKLHYSFNLRDVSKVVQGLMRSSSKLLKSSDELISLFIHEVMRVFADRTVNAFDNELVCRCVAEVLNTCPGAGIKKALGYEPLFEDDGQPKVFEENQEIPKNTDFYGIWGNYMNPAVPIEDRVLENKEVKNVTNILCEYRDDYNNDPSKQKMHLVLFEDAVMYVSKIARILSSERGNLLNVGVGGSGRKSLTKLAAFMCEYKVESIQLKKGYNQSDFHNDVKLLYLRCGLKGENIVFLLDESQLISAAILEDINNILNSGIISNLFDAKDMEKIINDTRQFINEQGLADDIDTNNKATVYNFFINRVRDKLHIVLCLSPSGDEFRARLRTYPSLLTCTSIVWFHPWPRSALLEVSKNILQKELDICNFEALPGITSKNLAAKLAPVATEIHSNTERLLINYAKETNRRHYLPPATFLDLLALYSKLLKDRINQISTRLMQYKTGVQRLIDAKSQVEILQQAQEELKPQLEKKNVVVNELIEQINKDKVQVEEMRKKAIQDAAVVASQAKDCQMIAADADKDLKAAEPMIEKATRAVDNIDNGMIAEIRSVKNPTELVFLTMKSVAALMGYKPDWPGCVSMLSNSQFLINLKSYDKNNISDQILKALKKFTDDDKYNLDNIQKVSVACRSLADWVVAIEQYAYVYRDVAPKKARLSQANEDLAKAEVELKIKQEKLQKVEADFKKLNDKFNESNNEKIQLEKQMELTIQRLNRAEQLTEALGDERVRWIKQSEELGELMTMVVGDVFLAACGIGYFGVFNRDYREKLITYWHGLLEIYGFKTSALAQVKQKGLFGLINSDEIIIERWKNCDLPNDMQSIDNALIMDKIMTTKWPLLIDPQNQAVAFIKKLEKNLKVIRPTQNGIIHLFEQALHDGVPVLLDGVGEKLDPILQPIIEKQYIEVGKQGDSAVYAVNLGGDSPVEVHKDFKLYITTKLQNPRYSPETHAKLQIVNFSISVDALEQQILSDVIQLEYPKLEETRVELTKDASQNKQQLAHLADQILYNLSSFQGSVLDNEPLIQVLNESKQVSITIKEKEIASASTRAEIAKYYAYYKPIGIRSAILYFLISDMSMVESMYLFALSYYKQLVNQEIRKVNDYYNDPEHIAQRVEIIIEKITFNLFTSISRGLFEKDKSIFSLLLGIRIYQRAGKIKPEEWALFVKGKVFADIFLSDPINVENKSEKVTTLLTDLEKAGLQEKTASIAQVCCYLPYLFNAGQVMVYELNNIVNYIKQNKQQQSEIINHIINLNSNNNDKFELIDTVFKNYETTIFQRLIICKVMADEYFYVAVPQFIECLLDERYASIKPQSIRQLYDDSTQFSPILFIISEGVDPVAQTQALAEELDRQVVIISLGKGQTELVRRELVKATQEGKWIFLQNVHLASADFLPELEVIVETLGASQQTQISTLDYITLPLHHQFRLLLSSTPVSTFPQSVLQASLKCTTEPPLSIKKNIHRQVEMLDTQRFEMAHMRAQIPQYMNEAGVVATWKRILYSLIYFHSQILERKKFGPQGYNLNYDFNDTDLEICILTLENFFQKIFAQESQQILTDSFINLDWDALKFIFSKIHYSGKVNDSWDKRCVKTLLVNVINNNIVKCTDPQNPVSQCRHTFVEGDDQLYALNFLNADTTLNDLMDHAQKLPSIDSTKVFGMSDNSDIVNQQTETARIIARVLGVSADCLQELTEEKKEEEQKKEEVKHQDKKLHGAELAAHNKQKITELNLKVFGVEVKIKTQDEIVKDISDQLLKKLPQLLSINDACSASLAYDENNIPLCMTTILKQDMERFNQLLEFIKKSLQNVILAIKGDVILSQDLEDQYKSLYLGKVPIAWSKIAYPSLKPLASWFEDLILRVEFMRRWLTQGPPKSFWISGLYFPQGFVTALLQTHARRYKKSVDSLTFEFQFSATEWENWEGLNLDIEKQDSTAVWVHGLYLDCGYFDLQSLKLQGSKQGMLYPKLPYVRFIPTEVKSEKIKSGIYKCPVYKTSQRAGVLSSTGHSTNFILPMVIPAESEQAFFIRLGTCALCQLDD